MFAVKIRSGVTDALIMERCLLRKRLEERERVLKNVLLLQWVQTI